MAGDQKNKNLRGATARRWSIGSVTSDRVRRDFSLSYDLHQQG